MPNRSRCSRPSTTWQEQHINNSINKGIVQCNSQVILVKGGGACKGICTSKTYLSKHYMLPVKMRAGPEGHKELAAVGVLSPVGHRQHAPLHMGQELLVFEVAPQVAREGRACIDGLAARPIPRSNVSPLDHEIRHDAVDLGPFVSKPLLGRAQCAEVLASDGGLVIVQSEDQSTLLAVVDRDDHECMNAAAR